MSGETLRAHLDALADATFAELGIAGIHAPRPLICIDDKPWPGVYATVQRIPGADALARLAGRHAAVIHLHNPHGMGEAGIFTDRYLPLRWWPWWRCVVIHEVAHLLARGPGHGPGFRKVARNISDHIGLPRPHAWRHRGPHAARIWPLWTVRCPAISPMSTPCVSVPAGSRPPAPTHSQAAMPVAPSVPIDLRIVLLLSVYSVQSRS